GDADAAENEILPRRFQGFVRAIDPDHHHGGQRGNLDRDPHEPDIVGHQRQVHGEHQHLVHGMVEAQVSGRQPACLELVRDVTRAEDAGGEADESVEGDEHHVEIVDDQVIARRIVRAEQQRQCGDEAQKCRHNVDARGKPIARQDGEHGRRAKRYQQHRGYRIEMPAAHCRSPRNGSSACTSTVSKRWRIRNRKMPMTMKAIRIEKATLISTTSGIPLAPVAASTNPFSSDMKPTTWLTALRRVTMIKRPSSTTDSANARSSRASGSASAVTRSISTMESATSAIPASMVGPIPTADSMSR